MLATISKIKKKKTKPHRPNVCCPDSTCRLSLQALVSAKRLFLLFCERASVDIVKYRSVCRALPAAVIGHVSRPHCDDSGFHPEGSGQGGAETVCLGASPLSSPCCSPAFPGSMPPYACRPLLLRRLPPALEWFYNACTFNCSKIDGHNYPVPRRGTCGLAYVGSTSAKPHVPPQTACRAAHPDSTSGWGLLLPTDRWGSVTCGTYNRGRNKSTRSSSILLFQRGLEAWGQT